jgi:ABC-type multidrug transport system ATPase subunit
MTAIKVEGLSKSYGDVQALASIDLSINKGELFGLIGPDGAGKSTLFRILTSLLIPDEGQAWVQGLHTVHDFRQIRNIIGYMPGRFSLYEDLSVEENLRFFAKIFGQTVEGNYHLIEDIFNQLMPFRKRRAGKLSGGMKQKLALCCALIHEPEVLFLDEPTTGVDAVSRAEFWEMLNKIKEKGITICVSTPYMDEAGLCERIALIQQGKILGINTPHGLINNYNKQLYSVRSQQNYKLLSKLRNEGDVERVEPFGETLHLTMKRTIGEKEINEWVKSLNVGPVEINRMPATVEDIFLDLMAQ